MNEFVNRTGTNLNRKILKVVSEANLNNEGGYEKEIIVDEFRDEENITSGTKLTAENMNTIVNNLAEAKVYEVLQDMQNQLNSDIESIEFNSSYIDDFTLVTELESGTTITWEVDPNNYLILEDNKAKVTRTQDNVTVTLKATFNYLILKESREYNITIKGTKNSYLVDTEFEVDWVRKSNSLNEYTITLESTDGSYIIVDEGTLTGNSNEVYIDELKVRNSKSKYTLTYIEKETLNDLEVSTPLTSEVTGKVYFDSVVSTNMKEYTVKIKYNPVSSNPED